MNRKQLTTLAIMLVVYALSAFLAYAFFFDQMTSMAKTPMPETGFSHMQLGLINAGVVLVAYSLFGWLAWWFARKLGLPGIFSADGNARRWFLIPLLIGLACGVFVVAGDLAFAPINGVGRFPHPGFPSSILASLSAAIGEELLFRGLVFGLWALILNWLFKRFNGRTAALWIANVIAALAFAAGHLPTVLVLTGATSLAEVSPVLLLEIFLLNGVVGLVAGQRYMKDGLVAASGVHFWSDMVFHVAWGLLG
jgi:membrane protease YdiL (CAAX protease family)